MAMVNNPPKYPVYNPDTDGNKFEWILRQADIMRESQQDDAHRPRQNINYLTGKITLPASANRSVT